MSVTPRDVMPHDPYRKAAQFSSDRRYRYSLYRAWHADKPMGAFIGANPSYADEEREDTTVTKCMRFASKWGWGGMYMLNVRAFVATNPLLMPPDPEGIGPDNDVTILQVVCDALLGQNIVAAWGHLGGERGFYVARLLERAGVQLYCLGTTHANEPRHPSRIGYATQLQAYIR